MDVKQPEGENKPAVVEYEVTAARMIAGQHRAVGETVSMTARAARYYTAPYGTGLAQKKATGKPKAKSASAGDGVS